MGGNQHVRIDCEDDRDSRPARRDDRNSERERVQYGGCLSYVVAKDSADENVLWVTEAWDSAVSHDASLSLPSVKNAIPRARAIISTFEKIAVTTPAWGDGLLKARAQ
jgi:quinol monooxygenase YgiN